jgi:hypothetical protein
LVEIDIIWQATSEVPVGTGVILGRESLVVSVVLSQLAMARLRVGAMVTMMSKVSGSGSSAETGLRGMIDNKPTASIDMVRNLDKFLGIERERERERERELSQPPVGEIPDHLCEAKWCGKEFLL